jgi:hypothetical protein
MKNLRYVSNSKHGKHGFILSNGESRYCDDLRTLISCVNRNLEISKHAVIAIYVAASRGEE